MRCPSLKDLPAPPAGKEGWPWTEESPPFPNRIPDDRSWPRVSIITPSYNQGEFLEETIRSVLLQGYPNLEYIIMDGGSSDASVDIIRKYDSWITYWVSEPDQGQTHAINQGWKNASGEIVAYINSDDYYLPGTVAVVENGFRGHPHAGMIYGTAIVVDALGKELRIWEGQTFSLKRMLAFGSIVPQPASFFRMHALKSVGYLDEQWHMIMDYEVCIRIGLQFQTVCLPVALAAFRDHGKSKTHAHYEEIAQELTLWLRTFAPEQVPPDQLKVMKQSVLGRVHYECASNYVAKGREHASKAWMQLVRSIYRYPLFALQRPLDTTYIIKEIFISSILAIVARIKPTRQQVIRK